jgi:hypothetical protein
MAELDAYTIRAGACAAPARFLNGAVTFAA